MMKVAVLGYYDEIVLSRIRPNVLVGGLKADRFDAFDVLTVRPQIGQPGDQFW